jgi:gas vesicle protein
MDSDQERLVVSFTSGLVLGAMIGAGVALLTTPHSGRKTRRRIRKRARNVRGSTTHRLDDLAGELKGRVDEAVAAALARVD